MGGVSVSTHCLIVPPEKMRILDLDAGAPSCSPQTVKLLGSLVGLRLND